MKLHRFLLTSILVFGFAGPSQAAILFSNLGQTNNGSSSLDDTNFRLASDFRTDGSPSTITSITALMGNSGAITHNITFSLFTDNGSGQPGTLVGAFATPASIPAGGFGNFTATTTGINLLANTPYWLVGQVNETTVVGNVTWRFNLSEGTDGSPFTAVAGTDTLRSITGGATYSNNSANNFLYRLDGVPTPEPSSLTLLAFATVSLAGCARRRQRRDLPKVR